MNEALHLCAQPWCMLYMHHCWGLDGMFHSFLFVIAVQSLAPQASNFNCTVVVESLLSAFVALSASLLGGWWGGLVLGGGSRHPWCNSNLLLWACRCSTNTHTTQGRCCHMLDQP